MQQSQLRFFLLLYIVHDQFFQWKCYRVITTLTQHTRLFLDLTCVHLPACQVIAVVRLLRWRMHGFRGLVLD